MLVRAIKLPGRANGGKQSGDTQAELPVSIKGYIQDLESLAIENENFRQVLYTTNNCQLVVMSLKPQEDIGEEVHQLDQILRVEEGTGELMIDDVRTTIHAGSAMVVPAGARHNVINTGDYPLKLSTVYAPPNHRDGVLQATRNDASSDDEHFDGRTTE